MTAGRAARTISCHPVVATRVRAERVGCADGDYRGLVAGRVNLSVALSTTCILTVVAGSGDHHYARVNQRPRRATDWIVLVAPDRRVAEPAGEHAELVIAFV